MINKELNCFDKIIAKGAESWLDYGRLIWSKMRYPNDIVSTPIRIDDSLPVRYFLLFNAKDIYKKFHYTYDTAADLFDAMHSPAECYKRSQEDGLYDDCDGFHAALYYISFMNGLNSQLLTYVTDDIKNSHTVLLVKNNNKYYIVDYTTVIEGDSFEEVFKDLLNKRKVKKWLAYNSVIWDYNIQRFRKINLF